MDDQETWRIGPGPTTRSAQRREARRRQRRRWAIGAVAALACVAVLVTYLGPVADPPGQDAAAPAGTPTPAGYPTGVAGLGDPAETAIAAPGLQPRERTPSPTAPPSPTVAPAASSPAAPTVSVSRAEVPAEVDLTGLGTRDWVHWGLNRPETLVRRSGGSGEIRDEGGRGARDRYDTNPELFGWRNGTPVPAVGATGTGVFVCGVGNGFTLAVTGSGEPRTVHLFAGLWMARGRLDVRLSTGGPTRTLRLEDPHTTHTTQFVIRFRAPQDEKLLIRWTVEGTFNSSCGNVNLQAAAVR
ncbi:hypothetical protein ABZ491_17005 [Micromonospora rifamycinica]|uniref:hypothetical protein n=1 Tax=Micromonospora rifamycinica TaxID=291594 RepID=UPI0033DA867D